MLIFIGIFLTLYGGLNFYFYRKIFTVLPAGHWPIAAILAFLVIAPVLIALLRNAGLTGLAMPLAWIGYTWMGLVFLFFSFSFALDLCRLLIGAAEKLWGVYPSASTFFSAAHAVLLAFLMTLAAAGYGFVAARQVKVERICISTPKLDKGSGLFRIVQISDLHLGLMSDTMRLRRIIRTIESIRPDVVVSTGDLVDMQLDHLGRYAEMFHGLKPPFGKYAVTGNHEVYAGLDQALTFIRHAGFTRLSYEGVQVKPGVNIVGVDDPALSRRIGGHRPSEKTLLERFSGEAFTVLLKHQPVVDPASLPWLDLQLSGHTHGGQIFPFILLTKLAYPVRIGLSNVGEGKWLYVSRGTGTWGPPIRFLASPELTVIELRPEGETRRRDSC